MGAKELWVEWSIRGALLISLFLQLVLTLVAKSRKRSGSFILKGSVWLFYLLADWMAVFAVGLISSRQTNNCPEVKTSFNKQLAAFWAPFLLLHLGGPDSISAFSLEDNELWIRHAFGLVIQLVSVVYVFVQSQPNEYWVPIVAMFLAGACKFVERTVALYQACLENFKKSLLPSPDAGPNYAQLMQECAALRASEVPVKIVIVKEPEKAGSGTRLSNELPEALEYKDIVLEGHRFFKTFKGLIVDDMFSFHERNDSRNFFFKRTPGDAFAVMEVELNFMYDFLYTKMAVVHGRIAFIFRLICTVLICVCFQQFASLPHHEMGFYDRAVTYVLLSGAIFLDMVNLFNLVFSDWMIVFGKTWVSQLVIRSSFGKPPCRWSNAIYQHSLISFCLKERVKWFGGIRIRIKTALHDWLGGIVARLRVKHWLHKISDRLGIKVLKRWLGKIAYRLGIKTALHKWLYKEEIPFKMGLKKLIFDELKSKAEEADSTEIAKKIYSARGCWALSNSKNAIDDLDLHLSISSTLSDKVEYDESVLLWHIATELCYIESSGKSADPKRELCKVLSNYMSYLLVMRPTTMSAVAGIAQIRYQDTCKEAKKFFQQKRWDKKVACKMLLDVKTVVKPSEVKGDRSKSLLFDACMLANDLIKLKQGKWDIMSSVWVELLSFAASHCRPDVHARQLSQGGELMSFVWLLMVHFGLGQQFRIEAGHARAKLIIQKEQEEE